MQDLFQTLDAGAEVKRVQKMGRMTETRGTGLPTALHTWLADNQWKPKPGKSQVAELMAGANGDHAGRFGKDGAASGGDVGPIWPAWKPEVLDGWAAAKCTSSRTASLKGCVVPPSRFPIHSRPLPEPSESLCSKMHREWMVEHAKARDKHLYPVYYARLSLERATAKVEEKDRQRMMAREIMDQARMDNPVFGETAKRGIVKMKQAIKGVRFIAQDSAWKRGQEGLEAKRDKELIERARSHPALQIKAPDPEGQGMVRHQMDWAAHNVHPRSFRESTNWVETDGMKELHKLGRISKAALMGRTV